MMQGSLVPWTKRAPRFIRLGAYLAQVVQVYPDSHSVGVMLPSLEPMFSHAKAGLTARVMEHRASAKFGASDLPRVGDWGVVLFPHNGVDHYPIWLGSIYQNWTGVWSKAREYLYHHDSHCYVRVGEDGAIEVSHPSGTYIKFGTSTTLDARTRYQESNRAAQSVSYDIPTSPAINVHVQHSSGATITIDPTGAISITTPSTITMTATGDITISSQSDVNIVGARVNIN